MPDETISRSRTYRCVYAAGLSEEQLGNVVQDNEYADNDARQLEDGDLIPRSGHAGQAAGRALELGGHGGEGIGGAVNDLVGARVVVDVDRYAPEGRDLGRQLVKAGVVLTFALIGF